jgi:beta-lactamase class A
METTHETRRRFLLSGLGVALGGTIPSACAPPPRAVGAFGGPGAQSLSPLPEVAALEARAGGRLGVTFLDVATGRRAGHRGGERFAMCSTFKLPLAAIVLKRVDEGVLTLDRTVAFGQADMTNHAPVSSLHLAAGRMSVGLMAEAIQTTSDNPAANLLLRLIGGPEAMTAALRALGDPVTRIDRYEPLMNLVGADDPRDTTTPAAMAATLRVMLTEGWLSPEKTRLLLDWMIATRTGLKRLRAGLPEGWRAGDKTGTGDAPGLMDKYNDVAIVWPPGRGPLIVTAFYEATVSGQTMRDEDQAVLAEVGRIAAEWAMRAA